MYVATMQPAFMPWQGFFELISRSDIFVILDDFQFSIQSYHQRNRLFTNRGQVGWYTVPVQKTVSFKAALNQTRINESTAWRQKLWKRIDYNYSKTSFYAELAPLFKEWLFTRRDTLGEQNSDFIMLVCKLLGLTPRFSYSSQFPSKAKRSLRVLELLRYSKATRYYCAKGSFEYMHEEKVFPAEGIELYFQDFSPQEYKQAGATGGFVPGLSILDALMNVGPKMTGDLVRSGTKKWLSWDQMQSRFLKNTLSQNKGYDDEAGI